MSRFPLMGPRDENASSFEWPHNTDFIIQWKKPQLPPTPILVPHLKNFRNMATLQPHHFRSPTFPTSFPSARPVNHQGQTCWRHFCISRFTSFSGGFVLARPLSTIRPPLCPGDFSVSGLSLSVATGSGCRNGQEVGALWKCVLFSLSSTDE